MGVDNNLCNAQDTCMPKPPELIGSAEACEVLGIDRSTLSRWVKDGLDYRVRLPGRNGAFLFDRAVIEAKKREREPSA